MTSDLKPTDHAGQPLHRGAWLVLAIVCLAQFMVVLDATIVNVALPTMQRDLHFSSGSLQWVINAYTLLFGGFLLLGGRAADLFGRRRLFLTGVVLFTAASVLDGFAQSSGQLIAARALQGLGGALVSPAALSIVTTTFPDGRLRARAMGVWAAIAVGGGAIGLLLGGILTEYASWRWVFFVNVPVGLITFLLASRRVPESHAQEHRGFDLAGAVSVTGGLVALVYGIVKAQSFGWGSPKTLGLLGAAVALLAAFVVIERRSAAPLVQLGIFRMRSLTAANATMLVVAGGMFAIFFFATLYVQQILHLSPVQSGLGFLPLTAMIILASGIAQQVIGRIGVRTVALVGMSVAAAGLLLLSRAHVHGSYLADVLPGIVVMGLGLGFTFVPLTLIGTTGVDEGHAGLASGLFNTSQQVGGALGLAILSSLAANRTSDEVAGLGHAPQPGEMASALVSGYHVAFVAGAGLILLGVLFAATLIRARDVTAFSAPAAEDAHEHRHQQQLTPAYEQED
ncbi:MAG: MFS transporter [Thermoleophilia bacterium]